MLIFIWNGPFKKYPPNNILQSPRLNCLIVREPNHHLTATWLPAGCRPCLALLMFKLDTNLPAVFTIVAMFTMPLFLPI